MGYQTIFKRYEIKYLMTKDMAAHILQTMEPHMIPDEYGATTIRNIYFDTDSYRLIRRSIEKPRYKEKLRVRSYSRALPDSTVFVELKKKYRSVVYKRRLSLKEEDAVRWLCGNGYRGTDSQIAREINYFLDFYGTMHPAVFLSYKREAYFGKDNRDFRITFDRDILTRDRDVSLTAEAWGSPILDEGYVLMEVKCNGGMPLWLTSALSELHLYKTPFSKYGKAYEKFIFPKLQGPKEFNYNGQNIQRCF